MSGTAASFAAVGQHWCKLRTSATATVHEWHGCIVCSRVDVNWKPRETQGEIENGIHRKSNLLRRQRRCRNWPRMSPTSSASSRPYETPLLDHLGDAARPAASTYHEWLEDALLPNTRRHRRRLDNAGADTTFGVVNADRFRVGDQVRPDGSRRADAGHGRRHAATARSPSSAATAAPRRRPWPTTRSCTSWATRPWKATTPPAPASPTASARATGRRSSPPPSACQRQRPGRPQAARWPTSWTTRSRSGCARLLRDLENTVINGAAPADDAQGSDTRPPDDEGHHPARWRPTSSSPASAASPTTPT